jgi:hypothetical protein
MAFRRREFIGAGLGVIGAGAAAAQNKKGQAPSGNSSFLESLGGGRRGAAPPPIPARKGKITKLFKSPEGYPNAMALTPEGVWLGEQKSDHAILVDWDGRLQKTVKTESKNTSGMGVGGGFIWMGANSNGHNGIFQTDLNSKTVTRREIPLGGGGTHGVLYQDGKLWIAALRLRGILKVDAKTWEPEFMIPYAVPRAHGVAWDNGNIWMVTGDDQGAGLIKYEAATGRTLETVRFDERFPDPHGLALKDGVLYTCDAGIHPGWADEISTATGYVCRIEIT